MPLSEAYAQEAATLAPVVVTGTRTERALDDVPVRVEVVSREEITRTHARTLKEALENVPGLQLREVHGKSGFELSLQGLTSDQVLVLIDGLPISASTGSTVDLSQYLVSDVARIEVVKGASSAQYGSSAMGGVVNVITRPIEQGFGGSATVDVGSYGSQNDNGRNTSANNRHGRFNLGGGGETWRLALSGDSMDGDGFGLDPEKWSRQGDASKRQQLTARAQWLPRKEGNFWVELGHYTEDDVQRYEYFVPPKYVPQRKTEDITRDRVTFGGDWKFDNGLRAEVKGASVTTASHVNIPRTSRPQHVRRRSKKTTSPPSWNCPPGDTSCGWWGPTGAVKRWRKAAMANPSWVLPGVPSVRARSCFCKTTLW